jgi:hypothetical protein
MFLTLLTRSENKARYSGLHMYFHMFWDKKIIIISHDINYLENYVLLEPNYETRITKMLFIRQ